MSQITLTSGANPAFLSKNYINRDAFKNGGITASTGDASKKRIFDMDAGSLWGSSNSSDGTEESIEIALMEGASGVSRSVDFFALFGMNFKNFIIEYKDENGANTWTTVAGSDFTGSDNSATEIGSAGSCSMKNAASFSDNSPTKDKTCGDAAARWRCAAMAFSSIPNSDADCSPVKPGGFRKTRRCGYGIRRSTGLLGGVGCCGTVPRGYNPLSSTIRWLSPSHVDDRQIHSLRVH